VRNLEVQQTELLCAEGIESSYTLESRKTELAIAKNRAREAELEIVRLEASPVAEEVEVSEKALAVREADLALARVGDKEVQALVTELATRKGELSEAKANLAKCLAVIEGMTLKSPVAGMVIRTFASPGEVCRKGEPAVLVTDDQAGRWVEAFIHEQDAERIKIGQRAKVEIVIGSRDYMDATVEAIAATTSSVYTAYTARSTAGPTSPSPGVPELVCVKLRPVEDTVRLLPGMSARAIIRVR